MLSWFPRIFDTAHLSNIDIVAWIVCVFPIREFYCREIAKNITRARSLSFVIAYLSRELYIEFRDAATQQVSPSIISFESLSNGSATHSMFAELQQTTTVSIAESEYMGDDCRDSWLTMSTFRFLCQWRDKLYTLFYPKIRLLCVGWQRETSFEIFDWYRYI